MVLLSGFIGALIGALVTFAFNMWKFHRDERNARCDDLCKAVVDAGTLAIDYWSSEYKEENVKQRTAEARLLAAQALVDGLYEDFRGVVRDHEAVGITQDLSTFIDLLTGGKFTESERPMDLDRVTHTPQTASLIVVAIRRVNRRSMPFSGLVAAIHANRNRHLDMPSHWPRK